MPIKVLVADHTDLARRAICVLLQSQPEIELVGEASDFAQTMRMTKDLKPQVVVMDLHMPADEGVSPPDMKALLKACASGLLAISIWNDKDTRALANTFGAASLLDKIDLGQTLVPAILQLAFAGDRRQKT
jgi:chemotaxis response regulator CheB